MRLVNVVLPCRDHMCTTLKTLALLRSTISARFEGAILDKQHPGRFDPMDLPSWQLRTRAACSVVKLELLGELYDPVKHQASSVVRTLEQKYHVDLDRKTWMSWWQAETPIDLKKNKLAILDRLARKHFGGNGAVSALLSGKAFDNPLHLHFDALDAASYCGGETEESWLSEREKRATQVLVSLHRKWRPGLRGQINLFPSKQKAEFDAASPERRKQLEHEWSGLSHIIWKDLRDRPPSVSIEARNTYNVFSPASVAFFLFAIGLDRNFVYDEMVHSWALDLASAILGLFGLVWCFRHEFEASTHFIPYKRIMAVLDLLLDEDHEFDRKQFVRNIGYDELFFAQPESFENFWHARDAYKETIETLGLHRSAIRAIADAPYENRPAVFKS